MTQRLLARCAAALALTALPMMMAPAVARADDVPFTDENTAGAIALCDASNHDITSGSLKDRPFVVRAVSTAAVPKGYEGSRGGKATLYAYQPIDGIAPADWSGTQLTGGSYFTNDKHPMTAGTNLDYSMADFLSIYPTHWDGLVQLRIFYGAQGKTFLTRTYPAAVLKIEGDRWRVVQGGTADCADGKTVSSEKLLLPPSRFATPAPSGGSSTGTSASASPGAAGPGGGSASPSQAAAADDPSNRADSDARGTGSSLTAVVIVGAVLLAALLAAGIRWRRRTPPGPAV